MEKKIKRKRLEDRRDFIDPQKRKIHSTQWGIHKQGSEQDTKLDLRCKINCGKIIVDLQKDIEKIFVT